MIRSNDWAEANQRYLSAALAVLHYTLEQYVACLRGTPLAEEEQHMQQAMLQQAVDEAMSTLPAPAAITRLCEAFALSPFERDVLLLCAGMELDGRIVSLCAAAQGRAWDERSGYTNSPNPTFSLALAVLPRAHWNALTPDGPLRRWRLITVGAGAILTLSPLRIDERVLHYLTGISHLDERLATIVTPASMHGELVPSQQVLVERLIGAWSQGVDMLRIPIRGGRQPIAIMQLCGEDAVGKHALAMTACTTLGLNLNILSVDALPTAPAEIEALARLWEREAILGESALLLDCDELDNSDTVRMNAIGRFIQQMSMPLVVTSRERLRLPKRQVRPVITFDVGKPSFSEQRTAWQHALGGLALNGHVESLATQFNLGISSIRAASAEVLEQLSATNSDPGALLWDACRIQARAGLDDLAQRLEPDAGWDDLVLPEVQQQVLREIVMHVRQRTIVYETWGFRTKGARGLGISALFAGASGTGKTLAAEVLAHELRLDLYRIDLSSVVSKYIGETEKNLRHVFDAAEEGGAILLFDEADALFGKRSEVKDSHDRYANIEVSYLLQRMEAYRGLAILTTNLKNALDTAFLRRIRFIVQFPFPDAAQRAEIWRRIFPSHMPTKELDIQKLARLNVAGGNIRNIALNAAFLAADAKEPVGMTHLLRASSSEYAKLEKSLTEAEIGGWV